MAVNVVCVEQNRGDGSYIYEYPMILDDAYDVGWCPYSNRRKV